jgi:hypothetical protein
MALGNGVAVTGVGAPLDPDDLDFRVKEAGCSGRRPTATPS